MADNDNYEDEYQFADPDATSAEAFDSNADTNDNVKHATDKTVAEKSFPAKSSVVRNALIVVAVVIVGLIVYPFMRSSPSVAKKVTPVSVVQNTIAPITAAPFSVATPEPDANSQITQKLSTLQASQEQMQTDFASSSSQLNGMNNNINDMMTKMTELNNTLALYAAKVDEQSRVIEQLAMQAAALKKAQTRRHVASRNVASPSLKYFIQAVIPGRAWLIATNGSTLTVREGTLIAGLGMVTLIDPRQGRVLTSSGQVIRFSQEDS